MKDLYLFARIAGTAVALCVDEIEAVVRLKGLSRVSGVPDHVAGLSALRSRVLTVIDASALVTGRRHAGRDCPEAERYAVMCDRSGHSYGILVDGVDDIGTVAAAAMPVCGRIGAEWAPYARGVIEREGSPHFLLSAADLLDQGPVPQMT
ncbi:MAG: chemotaxis protein CheW [Sphingobium sp.]